MRANMDENGVITLQAESSVEAYALGKWRDHALVEVNDAARRENCYWRGSQLLVISGAAPAHPGEEGKGD